MTPVTTTVLASDITDDDLDLLLEVTSNEPRGADTDWQVVDTIDGFEVSVRAQRDGSGRGRAYTIAVTATDDSGNSATATAEVTVAHDRRRAKSR